MSGQVDIGFSTPPFGLEAAEQGQIRIVALANDLESVRTQTVRVTIANANDLARRREVYDRFLRAYRDAIDFMYADPKAIEAFAKYAQISTAMAQTVRDRFYPKAMLQLDEIKGLDEMIQDAIAFKYIAQPLTPQQMSELLQLPGRRR
jgi:NitT/TauT family transport system substrate-binding protein